MNNKLVPVIVVALLAIGVAWYFLFFNNQPTDQVVPNSVSNTMPAEGELPIDPNTKEINLNDVTGGNSTGVATILRRDGTVFHTVTATMPALEGNNVYEGWLVRKSPFAFISTGVMTQEQENEFSLVYENLETDLLNYDQVVITLETVVDETPEEHIIEGSF